jgi:hypothetical protein
VAKSLGELLVPILFLAEGAFWLAIVATGGGTLLLFAGLAGILSGVLLVAAPSSWVTRPMAGASAIFALTLTLWQVYEAATLLGSNLGTVGLSSGVIFGVFAIVCVYLEMATISMGNETKAPEKA